MKKKSLFLSLFFMLSIVATSFATPTVKENTDLESKVRKALTAYNFDFSFLKGETIKIRFMLNEHNEIIVLSTNNQKLDHQIKGALNYSKIDKENLETFKVYILPVTFQS